MRLNSDVDVIVGGDLNPTGRNESLFCAGDSETIFGDLAEEFAWADFAIVNLECPFVDNPRPIVKDGPVFGVDPRCVNGLVKAHIRAVCLANNHIMDHGTQGLQSTIAACDNSGLLHLGAGRNLTEASRPLSVEIKGQRIGFVAMADHEFGMARKDAWGVNPTSVTHFVRTLRRCRDDLDRLVVLLHEGVQHYPFPTPDLQDVCRFMAEEGADAVICQHSHCPGSFEWHEGALLVYGQGDLISDPKNRSTDQRGFLVRLTFPSAGSVQATFIPYRRRAIAGGVRRMLLEEGVDFNDELATKSSILQDSDQLNKAWEEFCLRASDSFLGTLCGLGRATRAINRRSHFIQRVLRAHRVAFLLNLIRCEAHHQALETILDRLYREKTCAGSVLAGWPGEGSTRND